MDLVSYPARVEGLVNIIKYQSFVDTLLIDQAVLFLIIQFSTSQPS